MEPKDQNKDRLRKTAGGRRCFHVIAKTRKAHPMNHLLPKLPAQETPVARNVLFKSILKTDIIEKLRRIRRLFRQIFGENYF